MPTAISSSHPAPLHWHEALRPDGAIRLLYARLLGDHGQIRAGDLRALDRTLLASAPQAIRFDLNEAPVLHTMPSRRLGDIGQRKLVLESLGTHLAQEHLRFMGTHRGTQSGADRAGDSQVPRA